MTDVTRLGALAVLLACTVCATVYAEGVDQTPKGQQPATAAPPPKAPAPPLFPKHRRGIYKNRQGADVVDATPQSPPLNTDDPNVPDKGAWEINLSTFADLSNETHRVDLPRVDANYGIVPKIAGHELPTQVKFEFPVAAARATGDPFTFGVGAVTSGLKFNFYNSEQRGLSISVYPQVEFVPPGSRAVEKGLAEPGQTVILPLLVAKEFRQLTFVANGGVEIPVHAPDDHVSGTFGVGFGRALTRRLAAMIEIRGESAFASGGDRLMSFNVGVVRGVRNVIVYANWGHSLASGDDVSHTYLGVGLKVLVQPRERERGIPQAGGTLEK